MVDAVLRNPELFPEGRPHLTSELLGRDQATSKIAGAEAYRRSRTKAAVPHTPSSQGGAPQIDSTQAHGSGRVPASGRVDPFCRDSGLGPESVAPSELGPDSEQLPRAPYHEGIPISGRYFSGAAFAAKPPDNAQKKSDSLAHFRKAHQRVSNEILQWLSGTRPSEYGAKPLEVHNHPEARRLSRKLALFHPRLFLGVRRKSEEPKSNDRNARIASSVSVFNRHVFAQYQRALRDRRSGTASPRLRRIVNEQTLLISRQTGQRLRIERADSENSFRVVLPGSEGDGKRDSTRRLHRVAEAVENGLGEQLRNSDWTSELYSDFRAILITARPDVAHEEPARCHDSHSSAPSGSGRGSTSATSNGATPSRAKAEDSYQEGQTAAMRSLILQIQQIKSRGGRSALVARRCGLAVSRFARKLEAHMIERSPAKAAFQQSAEATAAMVGELGATRVRIGRLISSVTISRSQLPGNEDEWIAIVEIRVVELLKLILHPRWHRLIDRFGSGQMQLQVMIDEEPDRSYVIPFIREAEQRGESQRDIAADLGLSQPQVSGLSGQPDSADSGRERQLSARQRDHLRRAERHAATRRELTVTPPPFTKSGDAERLTTLGQRIRLFKEGGDPFPELGRRSSRRQLAAVDDPDVDRTRYTEGYVVLPAHCAASRVSIPRMGWLSGWLPLRGQDLTDTVTLLTSIEEPTDAEPAPDQLWRQLQRHVLQGAERPIVSRLMASRAVNRAEQSLRRFVHGVVDPGDPLLVALFINEMGGWGPILLEALLWAGHYEGTIAARTGISVDAIAIYHYLLRDPAVTIAPRCRPHQGDQRIMEALWRRFREAGTLSEPDAENSTLSSARQDLDRWMACLQVLGHLPDWIQAPTPAPALSPGELLSAELFFQKAWLTATTANEVNFAALESRLARAKDPATRTGRRSSAR